MNTRSNGLGSCARVGAALLCLTFAAQATQLSSSRQRPARPSKIQVEAPEIDPSLAKGLTVLLIGGVLVLTSRLRRRPEGSSAGE